MLREKRKKQKKENRKRGVECGDKRRIGMTVRSTREEKRRRE